MCIVIETFADQIRHAESMFNSFIFETINPKNVNRKFVGQYLSLKATETYYNRSIDFIARVETLESDWLDLKMTQSSDIRMSW